MHAPRKSLSSRFAPSSVAPEKIGPGEERFFEVRPAKRRAGQSGLGEVRFLDVASVEARPRQVGTDQRGAFEVREAEVRADEARAGETRSFEVHAAQIHAVQPGALEVASLLDDPPDRALRVVRPRDRVDHAAVAVLDFDHRASLAERT